LAEAGKVAPEKGGDCCGEGCGSEGNVGRQIVAVLLEDEPVFPVELLFGVFVPAGQDAPGEDEGDDAIGGCHCEGFDLDEVLEFT
jgi:hypothetical protein